MSGTGASPNWKEGNPVKISIPLDHPRSGRCRTPKRAPVLYYE